MPSYTHKIHYIVTMKEIKKHGKIVDKFGGKWGMKDSIGLFKAWCVDELSQIAEGLAECGYANKHHSVCELLVMRAAEEGIFELKNPSNKQP